MATEDGSRWLTIAQAARFTGLSDETIRKYCIATPKVHFPSARLVDDRWEIPEDELRAAMILDRSLVVPRCGLTESRLTQLERLGKLACSSEGKFSLDQELYLHTVKTLEDLASAPAFEERGARSAVTGSRDPAAPEKATVLLAPAAPTPALQSSGQPTPEAQRPRQMEIVFLRPGIALMDEFVEYMTEHKNPARLPDEFFAGEYALEFIPPVGVEYYVAWGPGGTHDENGPTHTWVNRYPRWTCVGKNLALEAEGEFSVEGFYRRGSVPDQYAEASAKYRLLRDHWNLCATEARARLRDRARTARVTFFPDSMGRPDVRGWLHRYRQQRLHPGEFPDSVKAALIDVPFIATYNMFFSESTGEVRSDGVGGEYTVIGITEGFSDEFGWVDRSPLDPLPALLMWSGCHDEGEVRPQDAVENAEYVAWKGGWEDMQREGRRLKARRDGE